VGIEEALLKIADRVLDFDESSLAQLQEKYLKRVSEFSPDKEWERAIIVYFIINSVRVKNKIFNEKIKGLASDKNQKTSKKWLKIVK
jgi:hypothetical protein